MKKNTTILRITAIIIGICLSGCQAIQEATAETLVDETNTLSAGQTVYTGFTNSKAVTVNVEVNVTSGDGVKFYLLDKDNLTKFLNGQSCQYYTSLSRNIKTTSWSGSATLPAGEWYIAIVNPNMLLAQTVSRKITANR